MLARHVNRQLDAVNRRRETRNKETSLGADKHLFKLAMNRALTRRVTLSLDVSRILQESQHSLFAVLRKTVQIKQTVISGSRVNFEVARMQHHAKWGVDGQGDAIDQAVRYLQRMNRKRPNFKPLSGTNLAQIGIIQQLMLVKFIFDISQRELGAPDRNIQFAEYPGQRADVIFVAVGKHDAAHILAIFEEIRNVGNDDIDAQQLGFGKHQPRVDHDNVIAKADGHAVHTELAHPAERNNV